MPRRRSPGSRSTVAGEDEFVLLVARRDADGFAIVAPVADQKLVDQAIRKSAA